ncbi:MAG: nuclear transport factor 2 family protein [Planctomycetota bacterium]
MFEPRRAIVLCLRGILAGWVLAGVAPAGAAVQDATAAPAASAVDPTTFAPLAVCLAGSAKASDSRAAQGAGGHVIELRGTDQASFARQLEVARATYRIRGGAMHLLTRGEDAVLGLELVRRVGHHFATWTRIDPPQDFDPAAWRALPARRDHVLSDDSEAALRAHFASLWNPPGTEVPTGEVHAALDAFHDAATKADEATYFALLPDDSVFLGTDASERWTGREFRDFALPYFQRETAWTYVSLRRHVTVADGGRIAWFDELLDNESYGPCRGSGVLERRDGRWVIRLYDLAMLVPNDAARDVVRRIREGSSETTTIVLVRHAEKAAVPVTEKDPPLSEAGLRRAQSLAEVLRDVPVAAVFATPFRRTVDTLAPLCEARRLTPIVLPPSDANGLVDALLSKFRGQTVVVCGHSNTVPAIARALGVTQSVVIDESTYDRLFVVSHAASGAKLLGLRY